MSLIAAGDVVAMSPFERETKYRCWRTPNGHIATLGALGARAPGTGAPSPLQGVGRARSILACRAVTAMSAAKHILVGDDASSRDIETRVKVLGLSAASASATA